MVYERREAKIRKNSYKDISETLASVIVVASSGYPVYHESYDNKGDWIKFYRSLEISEKAINLQRMQNCCPVLNNHEDGSWGGKVEELNIGTVHRAWIEDGDTGPLLMAELYLTKDGEENRKICGRVKDEIIRAVSIGAAIFAQEETGDKDAEIREFMATMWEVLEVSLVSIPADPLAVIRSNVHYNNSYKRGESMGQQVIQMSKDDFFDVMKRMSEKDKDKDKNSVDTDDDDPDGEGGEGGSGEEGGEIPQEEIDAVVEEVVEEVLEVLPEDAAAELESDIVEAVEVAVEEAVEGEEEIPADLVDTLAKKFIRKFKRRAYLLKTKRIAPRRRNRSSGLRKNSVKRSADPSYAQIENDALLWGAEGAKTKRDKMLNAMEWALVKACNPNICRKNFQKPLEEDLKGNYTEDFEKNPYMGRPLSRIASEILSTGSPDHRDAGGYTNTRLYSILKPSKSEKRSSGGNLATSGDFEALLSNAMTKVALTSYEMQRGAQTFDSFVTRVKLENFKEQERVRLGEHPDLYLTQPGDNFKKASMAESVEKYSLKTWGVEFEITRQALIDDNLNQIQAIMNSGRAAADLESYLVYREVVAGKIGGQSAYSAANNNLTTGKPLYSESDIYGGLKNINSKMIKQTGLNSKSPLRFMFNRLLLPVELWWEATTQQTKINAAEPKFVNPIQNQYSIIQEPLLDLGWDTEFSGNETTYYGIAAQAGVGGYTFLELATLENKPRIDMTTDFDSETVRYKIVYDVAAKLIDGRLVHKVTAT